VRSQALQNAHDIAEGGLAVALAECCLAGGIGARVELPDELEPFAEAPGRGFLVSGGPETLREWARAEPSAPCTIIGEVGGDTLEIAGRLNLTVSELEVSWAEGLAGFF
jgi:phosphoribosylformylglycinamidine synthase